MKWMDFKKQILQQSTKILFLLQLSMTGTLYCPQIQIASEKPIFLHGFCKR